MKSVGKERKACVFIALISAIWEQREMLQVYLHGKN